MNKDNIENLFKHLEFFPDEISEADIQELINNDDSTGTYHDPNLDMIRIQKIVINEECNLYLDNPDVSSIEKMKIRFVRLYYCYLDILLTSNVYKENKSELPEYLTLPYLYIKHHFSLNKALLKYTNPFDVDDCYKSNSNPFDMFMKGSIMLSDLEKDNLDVPTQMDLWTTDFYVFIKVYLQQKRYHLEIFNIIKTYYYEHHATQVDDPVIKVLNYHITIFESGDTIYGQKNFDPKIMYDEPLFYILMKDGLLFELMREFILNPDEILMTLEGMKNTIIEYDSFNNMLNGKRKAKGMSDVFLNLRNVSISDVNLSYAVDNKIAIVTKITAIIHNNGDTFSEDLIWFDKVTDKYKYNTIQGYKPTYNDLKLLYYLLGCSTKPKKPAITTIKSWKKKDWATRLNMFFNNRIPLDEFVPVIDKTTEMINPLWDFSNDNQ